MPLRAGSSADAIEENIKRLIAEGYTRDQAIAIAYDNAKTRKSAPPPVVFVKSAPDEYELLSGDIFARPSERRALAKFCDNAALADFSACFAIDDYLGRDTTREDFAARRADFLRSLDGCVVVAVGKSARELLGSRAQMHVTSFARDAEAVRKAQALRRLLDDIAASGHISIKLASAYAQSGRRPEAGTYATDSLSARVHKAEEEKRIVYGVVLDPYAPDAHDDWIPPAEIERTAHEFMRRSRVISLQHESLTDAVVVESFVENYPSKSDRVRALRKEPHRAYARKFGEDVIHSGAWVLGVELTPQLWEQYKTGDIAAFSIEGYAVRVPTTTGAMPQVDFIEIGAA